MKLVYKRLLAYLLDMLLLIICFNILNGIFKPNIYQKQLNEVNKQYILKNIGFTEYKNDFIKLNYQVDKLNMPINIIMTLLIIGFFIIIPYFKNGQTIGHKLMKIKLESNTIKILLLRNLIATGLGYMILMFLFLMLLNSHNYFVLMNFLAFCQILVVIINGFMILYSCKHLGLTDILTNTKVEGI